MDCRQPSSSVRGISQARILEWVAISFSRASSWPRDRTHVSCFLHWPEDSLPPGEKSVTSLFFDKNVYFCNYFIILLFICSSFLCKYFPGGSDGKEPACSAGDPGSIPGLGRCPGEGQGNHSNILAWKIPRPEEPGGLQCMGSREWLTLSLHFPI